MSADRESKSFWTTIPGILSGCAAIITAIAAVIGALVALGVMGSDKPQQTPNYSQPTSPPPVNDNESSSSASSGPDFLLTFDKFQYCGQPSQIPYASFRFENTGDAIFTYILMKIDDLDSGVDIYGIGSGYSSTGFHTDSVTCGVSDKPTLNPAEVGFISYALGSPDSITARHTARATVTLCEQSGPDFGACVKKRVDFTLYYP